MLDTLTSSRQAPRSGVREVACFYTLHGHIHITTCNKKVCNTMDIAIDTAIDTHALNAIY